MAERNLKTSPLYELTITGRQTGGQTDRQKKPLIGARAKISTYKESVVS